ncbi:uncharacterized protein LOC128239810 [Mya arenaria]|uniref:uncharacterized protein LOC128239810 n=1 Tax=Mya arenaria TaxID=6604 RepID=UPI0022E4328A|nr:uncharacterized protein LOC128239810 [Mya arenaria]
MKTAHERALKGATLMLLVCCSYVHGEIRCYCNEAKCVSSSYMCKSQLGMCFTHVKVKDGVKSIVSGCADSLQEEPLLSTCAGTGIEATETELTVNETRVINDVIDDVTGVEVKETTVVESVKETVEVQNVNPVPLESGLRCCTLDMCNYRDSNEITITIDTKTNDKGLGVMSSKKTDESNKAQKDLWFKAAVIAVPIAGGFILILLVLLAVRMLRTDSRQHKRLIQIRRERSLTKAQLYVTDHFIDREKDKNTCTIGQGDSLTQPSNTIFTGHVNSAIHNNNSQNPNSKRETVHSTHLNSNSKCHHHHHHHHSNKNNHPKATRHRDGHTYEQILSQTNSDTSTGSGERDCQTSPHSSVIVWGKSDNTNSADVV